MKVKKNALCLGLILISCLINSWEVKAQADDDLYVFGFVQTIFHHKNIEASLFPNDENQIPFFLTDEITSNSFSLHQLNLFFRKPIDDKTTFFLNIEATGSYSTETKSGSFKISEGWISHILTKNLNFKVGLLLPSFNNLNEISNRLPLFPYLVRPAIYERLFDNQFVTEDYIPKIGYLQINGNVPIADELFFDMSFQIGNAESSYQSKAIDRDISSSEASTIYRGENLSEFLSFSGRIGVSNYLETIKFGISSSVDHDNKREPRNESMARLPQGVNLPAFGDVRRYRVGLDFSFRTNRLEFELEYIGVFHDHSDIHKTPQYATANLNKKFVYGLLNYNWNSDFFTYAGWSYIQDHSYELILKNSPDRKGINIPTLGLGWKTPWKSTVKAQWTRISINNNPHMKMYLDLITVGVSTIF